MSLIVNDFRFIVHPQWQNQYHWWTAIVIVALKNKFLGPGYIAVSSRSCARFPDSRQPLYNYHYYIFPKSLRCSQATVLTEADYCVLMLLFSRDAGYSSFDSLMAPTFPMFFVCNALFPQRRLISFSMMILVHCVLCATFHYLPRYSPFLSCLSVSPLLT